MLPLVSIITVTKNLIDAGRSDCFRQCVESVRMQDYPNIEHLIIDGASTDGSQKLFQELGLTYVSEPDSGISDAYNKGIQQAKGEYIAFLSDDDLYTSARSISIVINALQENDADYSYAPFSIIDSQNNLVSIMPPQFNGFPLNMPFGYPTMFTKKHVLDALGGHNKTYKICGDFDLVSRVVLNNYKPVFIPEVFVAWRTGGISDTQKEIVKKENILVVSQNTGLDFTTTEKYYNRKYLPKSLLVKLLSRNSYFPDISETLKHNRKKFLRYIRKWICTLHLRKGKRCFRLLGITFYNEEKK